jgi:D-threo-aldose 1-dehydrogenase
MDLVRLDETDVTTSVLGFGCADLRRQATTASRWRLLEAAFDAGIRHFDVAPMYGLGKVESDVGGFARGRRDELVIATKFGIAPSSAARMIGPVQWPLRRLLDLAARTRDQPESSPRDARSGMVGSLLYRSDGYDARGARTSLEGSLRRLATDHVDVLFLHDPVPGDMRSDDVREYLESAQAAGSLRTWGVAGEAAATVEVARALGPEPVPVVQMRGDVFVPAPSVVPDVAGARILFGVVSRALPRILAHVRSGDDVRRRWSEAVGRDCGRADEIVGLLLQDAVAANPRGPVRVSTTRPERIRAAASAVDSVGKSDAELDAFLRLLTSELGAAVQP